MLTSVALGLALVAISLHRAGLNSSLPVRCMPLPMTCCQGSTVAGRTNYRTITERSTTAARRRYGMVAKLSTTKATRRPGRSNTAAGQRPDAAQRLQPPPGEVPSTAVAAGDAKRIMAATGRSADAAGDAGQIMAATRQSTAAPRDTEQIRQLPDEVPLPTEMPIKLW
jgi:hypothetical protein